MITTLQRTDRFLLEHAYAQAQLYYTQLYTEAEKSQEEINAELRKEIESNKKQIDSLEGKLDSKTGAIIKWTAISAGKLLTAAAIYLFDTGSKVGKSLYVPGKENFDGGSRGWPTVDLNAINRNNTLAVTILISIALYHLKKGNYLAAFLFLLVTIPGVADKMQAEIFAVGAVSMLFLSLLNQLWGYDLTLPANQLIFKNFIVKFKVPIVNAITKSELLNQSVKTFFLWLIKNLTPVPKDTSLK